MLPYPSHANETVMAVFCFRENAMVRHTQQCWTCSWCQHGSEQQVSSALPAVRCAVQRQAPARMPQPPDHLRAA